MEEKFYYCQSEIEFREKCKQACDHCKIYYYPLEQERKMEDLKEWVENNVKHTIENIRKKSPILKEMESKGEIKIVGVYYSLETGKLDFIQ